MKKKLFAALSLLLVLFTGFIFVGCEKSTGNLPGDAGGTGSGDTPDDKIVVVKEVSCECLEPTISFEKSLNESQDGVYYYIFQCYLNVRVMLTNDGNENTSVSLNLFTLKMSNGSEILGEELFERSSLSVEANGGVSIATAKIKLVTNIAYYSDYALTTTPTTNYFKISPYRDSVKRRDEWNKTKMTITLYDQEVYSFYPEIPESCKAYVMS